MANVDHPAGGRVHAAPKAERLGGGDHASLRDAAQNGARRLSIVDSHLTSYRKLVWKHDIATARHAYAD